MMPRLLVLALPLPTLALNLLLTCCFIAPSLFQPASAFVLPSPPNPAVLRRSPGGSSSTALSSFSADNSAADDAADDDDFMSSLRTRMDQVLDRSSKMPLVVLDTMLPRQVLRLQVNNPALLRLVRSRISSEEPHVGVMGMAKLSDGNEVYLKQGVEVRIDNPVFVDGGVKLELRAGRRFEIDDTDGDDSVQNVDGGWTEARVKFLDSADEEEREKERYGPVSIAVAVSKCEQFTAPSANLENNDSLVDRWVELAKERERQPGQIDELLDCIGPIPPTDQPTERAFWIGSLINPLPAMGVAVEIRPSLLTAKTAEKRVDVALDGILRSIRHMDGSAKLWKEKR